MKKNLKNLFHIAIFAVVLSLILIKVTDIMEVKNSKNKYNTFFEEAKEYDVLFFGTSLVLNSVFPMELYSDYGITSYNFGNYASYMPVTYYSIMNALEYASPKLVVIDVFTLDIKGKVFNNFSFAHTSLDAFPMTYSKMLAVDDLFDNKDDKIEMMFTLAKYHSRWRKLQKSDFVEEANYNKGSDPRIKVFKGFNEPILIDKDIIPDKTTVCMEYIEKAIELCHSKGIEVLLTNMPHGANEKEQIYNNYGHVLAKKYDISYVDFRYIEDIVNYSTDYYDISGHLNPSGAYKITNYLGNYIKNNYDIPDRRTEELYESWKEDYKAYFQSKISNLNAQKDNIKNYLMLLSDDELECAISISSKITEEKNPLIFKLINNIVGISKSEENIYSNVTEEGISIKDVEEGTDINIVVYRKSTGDVVSKVSFYVDENIKILKY